MFVGIVVFVVISLLKLIIFGEGFSFLKYARYRGRYWRWFYRDRQRFDPVGLLLTDNMIGKKIFTRTKTRGYIDVGILKNFDNVSKIAYVIPAIYGNGKTPIAYKYKDIMPNETK